ncbi:MAG TPA: hypothetical protein QGF58_00385 [Myxococcota bacterium]|nr:hypothetical protein [Myxococcota bacterium]
MLLLIGLAVAQDVEVGGHAEGNLRLGLGCDLANTFGDCGWLDFHDAAVAGGHVRLRHGRYDARLEADLRVHGPSGAEALEEAGTVSLVQNSSLKLQEAQVTSIGSWLDLGIGAQRLHWGVADGLNPANVVNAYDLEDPTRFDQRLATPMLRALAHRGQASLEIAVVPWFQPALLPTDVVDVLGDGQASLDSIEAGDNEIGRLESRVDLPEDRIADIAVGARFFWATRAGDWAISGYHGRDSLPQVGGELRITGFQTDSDRVDLGVPIVYPRVQQVAGEWRRDLAWDVVGWVEVAAVRPEFVEVQFSKSQLEALERLGTIDEVPDPIPTELSQDGLVYPRWVVGVDRGFGQVYLNLQWLHGFPTERSREELRDYGVVFLRWSITPTVALEGRALSDGRGVLAGGDLHVLQGDAVSWQLGGTWVQGPPDSALGAFAGVSHIGTGARVEF